MAKRFTDTNKWAKASFSDLSLKMKVVWMYLCDKCDHAGIWDVNVRLLSFEIGDVVTLHEITHAFGEKVRLLDESKLFIPSFVEFQYGELNPENRAHKSVIKRLEKEGASKGLTSPFQGAKDKEQDKDKELDKEMDKEQEEGGVGETKPTAAPMFHPLLETWNENCGNLPHVRKTSVSRNRDARRLWETHPGEDIATAVQNLAKSDFCNGKNDRGWVATIDWFLNEKNFLKAFENKFDNRGAVTLSNAQRRENNLDALRAKWQIES